MMVCLGAFQFHFVPPLKTDKRLNGLFYFSSKALVTKWFRAMSELLKDPPAECSFDESKSSQRAGLLSRRCSP